MKLLRFFGSVLWCLAICASLAGADSLQLRNGRHLQGKYIGGTSTAIGFMSGPSVEYFATADVLAIMFDNSNDSPLGGAQQPSPMKADPPAHKSEVRRTRVVNSPPSISRKAETIRVNDSDVSDFAIDDQSVTERLLGNEWLSSL
jgi:hypothetical protein